MIDIYEYFYVGSDICIKTENQNNQYNLNCSVPRTTCYRETLQTSNATKKIN